MQMMETLFSGGRGWVVISLFFAAALGNIICYDLYLRPKFAAIFGAGSPKRCLRGCGSPCIQAQPVPGVSGS